MHDASSKESILKKIRKALSESTPLPFPQSESAQPIFPPSAQELEVQFAETFTGLQGQFAFCVNLAELGIQLTELLREKSWTKIFCNDAALRGQLLSGGFEQVYSESLADCDASITACENLVARTGSIVLSAAMGGRTPSVYAPVHICVAFTSQLVYDIKDALQQLKEKYSQRLPSLISFAAGPSRTADIEKTLVTGVHGPREVYVFLVDQA